MRNIHGMRGVPYSRPVTTAPAPAPDGTPVPCGVPADHEPHDWVRTAMYPDPPYGTVSCPGRGSVTLRRFAALVPMPYSTAREWRDAGVIHARQAGRGRWRVTLDQLPAVRSRRTGTPAPAPEVTP